VRLVAYLQAQLRRFQDRSGPPTLDDVRAEGVTTSHVYDYLRARAWYSSHKETGDERSHPWARGAPEWLRDDPPQLIEISKQTEIVIEDLASLEGRSPWAVLDDIAAYADPRPLFVGDDPAGEKHGPVYRGE